MQKLLFVLLQFFEKLEQKCKSKETEEQQINAKLQVKERTDLKDLRDSIYVKATKSADIPQTVESTNNFVKKVASSLSNMTSSRKLRSSSASSPILSKEINSYSSYTSSLRRFPRYVPTMIPFSPDRTAFKVQVNNSRPPLHFEPQSRKKIQNETWLI